MIGSPISSYLRAGNGITAAFAFQVSNATSAVSGSNNQFIITAALPALPVNSPMTGSIASGVVNAITFSGGTRTATQGEMLFSGAGINTFSLTITLPAAVAGVLMDVQAMVTYA